MTSKSKPQEKIAPVGVSEDISEKLREYHDAFAEEAEKMSGNLFGIASEVAQEDEYLSTLADSMQLIHNYLLNLLSRPDLLMGYVKRVYLNKESIDSKDDKVLISEDEYMYGDTPIAQPYAPLFKHLWTKHLKEKEKAIFWSFFRTYNDIVEDWILEGAENLFDAKLRRFDRRVLRKIRESLETLEDVPEDELGDSEELRGHCKLLSSLRKDFMEYRRSLPPPPSAATKRTKVPKKEPDTAEVSSVTVTKHGKQYDVEAVDVKVTKTSKSTSVQTVKVRKEMDTDPLEKKLVREKPVKTTK